MRPSPRRARRRAAALALPLAVLLTTAACVAADEGVDPSSADWPQAVDPAAADGDVWVVWTAVAETADDAALAGEVERLAEEGYEVEPQDPACHATAGDQLAGLTGFAEPAAVGVAFASAEDAGVFDTRDTGSTVAITEGAWTC